MRRALFGALLIAALGAGLVTGAYAAAKSYQFTGVVKSDDGKTLTVEKSAKETWVFEKASDTKGTATVGDKVTVHYKMIATEIEAKATTTPAAKKK